MSSEFSWVKPQRANAAAGDNYVYGRKVKAGRQEYDDAYQFAITIPEIIMKKARLVIGDKVEIGFAEDQSRGACIAVRRTLGDGYTITPASSGGKGYAASVRGKSIRGRVQVLMTELIPESFTAKNGGHEIDESGVLITWEGK